MKNYKTYCLQRTITQNFLFFVTVLLLFSCANKNYSSASAYQFKSADKKPDYNNLDYWAAHPWKKDLSDSVPKPLRNSYISDSSVDVFFLHPTTLTDKNDSRRNADIDDAAINSKTDYSTILYQASAFNEQTRVFAPRYRQAHLRAYYTGDTAAKIAFELAYQDVKNAFQYYRINLCAFAILRFRIDFF